MKPTSKIHQILSFYSVPKLRYGPLSLNTKTRAKVIKSSKGDNINNLCLKNRNKFAELYLPSTFQTSDIEHLGPKNEN